MVKKTKHSVSRRKFVKTAAVVTAGAGVTIAGFPAIGKAKRKLKYIAMINKNTVWGKPYFFLRDEVDRLSGGELKIQYVGGSEVVGGFDAPEAIAKGIFDISHSANAYFAGAMPSSISLASGNASIEKLRTTGVLDAYADVLMKKRGVMLLGTPLSGVGYVFQVRFRPDNLSTFKGKKIRSIPLYDPILESLGAVPVKTSPSEAYTSMERGVVDGLGWPDIGLLDFKFYEHAKYIVSPTFYTLRTTHLLNPSAFKGLPPELQEVLIKAARSADKIGAAWAKKQRDSEHAQMSKYGVEIVKLPPKDAKKFVDLTEEKLWAKIMTQSPTNGKMLKDKFAAL